MMDALKIERVGGLAGFGSASSRLASRGETQMSALSEGDRASVENLFKQPKRLHSAGPVRDGFRYRLTRDKAGRSQTVEVPEALVPEVLKECVKDTFL